jgi:uncharacterized protein (TIGR03083 family)
MTLGHDRFAAEILAQARDFSAALAHTDPGAAVPDCPEWTVLDLSAHVGRGLRWAAAVTAQRTFVPFSQVPEAEQPADPAPWLRAAAELLVATVAEHGADQPAWTWIVDQRAGFWLRRMTHELVVHRADAAGAAGVPFDVAPDLAADGVTEFFELIPDRLRMTPTPGLRALAGDGETLHLHATDGAGDWLVRRTPEGLVVTSAPEPADVTVRGPAAGLMLSLYGRRPAAEIEVLGDGALFEHLRENARF